MSKKETEFDRYERMRKLQREAEAEKKKSSGNLFESKKKGRKPKPEIIVGSKNWTRDYETSLDGDY